MTDQLEFVNDWSELDQALADLDGPWGSSCGCCSSEEDDNTHYEAVKIVLKYVPRLLTQYASLVELSFALTEGWEQYAQLNTPTGLYLPDHR